jgi:hypothetical protein
MAAMAAVQGGQLLAVTAGTFRVLYVCHLWHWHSSGVAPTIGEIGGDGTNGDGDSKLPFLLQKPIQEK